MFGHRLTLFHLFGFPIKIDGSWVFLAVLVTWSLASSAFPFQSPGFSEGMYWIMGIAGALSLFLSIILHEIGHSVVARRFGIPIRDITLFIFGGVAQMESEPSRARDEFWMAIAGPAVSILIAIVLLFSVAVTEPVFGETPAIVVATYVGWINAFLAIFNMVPAFPLDGGRVLRSALWAFTKNLRKSTRIVSEIGSGFGLALIFIGAFSLFSGNLVNGIWLILLGLFVRSASKSSYEQLLVRKMLAGQPISQFMHRDVVTVPQNATLKEFIERYVYLYHHKLYPVMLYDDLVGCITTRDVKATPSDEWEHLGVGEIMQPIDETNSVDSETDAMVALGRMHSAGLSRLIVVDDGRLAGIVTLKDLMAFISIKLEFGANA